MEKEYPLVKPAQLDAQGMKWKKILGLKENVCVVFPYLSDRQFRVHQWAKEIKKEESASLYPVFFDPSIHYFDEIHELENYITSQLPEQFQLANLELSLSKLKKRVILVLANGETLNDPKNYRLTSYLQRLLIKYAGKLGTFIAFETNISILFPSLHQFNLLFQNILYYELYSDQEVSAFISYLCKKWKLKMSSPIRRSITFASGGSFWLAKEACRIYRDTDEWKNTNESFQERLASIAHSLSEKEMTLLYSLPYVDKYKKTIEYKHLKNIGLITSENKLRIPLLHSFLRDALQPTRQLQFNDGTIEYRGISLSSVLSPTEFSLLKMFISKPNTPIGRDEIANVIWPRNTDKYYSQWAIDQSIKRLRNRLTSLQLPPTIISSVRGVGYEYRA